MWEPVEKYNKLLNNPHVSTIVAEYQQWIMKWKHKSGYGNKVSESLPELIENYDSDLFPNICTQLQILDTFPVSIASAKQLFPL